MHTRILVLSVVLLLLSGPVVAAAESSDGAWMQDVIRAAAVEKEAEAAATPTAEPEGDGPPLPLHTIEGVGGALTVPMAYLVNPGPKGTIVGKPAVSASFIMVSSKSLLSFAVSETLFRRIELSYAFNRFGLGSLPAAIKKVSHGALRVHRDEVYLHHFNIRGLVLEENSFDLPLPAVVVGAEFKVNGGIMGMDDSTGGALTAIGLDKSNGVDWTLHLSKTFPGLLCGRPLILTVGMRNSKASNIGYTGFGDKCQTTVEADVATLLTDKLAVGYEFRQKNNPYDVAPGIMGDEDDWHAIRAAYIVNDHFTIAGAWGYLGPVGNTFANCAYGVQLKYEF
jgi:hypothetical protein